MNIKAIREKQGLSINKLSKISSISQSYISELEKGKYEATESKIIRLSLALGCTPNELLGWDELLDQITKNLKR